MKLLLDTHTFLWFIEGNSTLSEVAKNLIENTNNYKFISIASSWEISIKISIGKLELGMNIIELIKQEIYGNAMELLDIKSTHLDELIKLSFHHKDPFDRLIIAASLAEEIPIVGKDRVFENYPIDMLW